MYIFLTKAQKLNTRLRLYIIYMNNLFDVHVKTTINFFLPIFKKNSNSVDCTTESYAFSMFVHPMQMPHLDIVCIWNLN